MFLLNYNRRRWAAQLGATAVGRRPDSDFLFGYITPIYYAAGYARVDVGGWYELNRHVTAYANLDNALNNHSTKCWAIPRWVSTCARGYGFASAGSDSFTTENTEGTEGLERARLQPCRKPLPHLRSGHRIGGAGQIALSG